MLSWLLFTHPALLLISKMLLVFLVLLAVSQFKLSASNQAMIWRIALLLILLMPILNQHLSVLNFSVATHVPAPTSTVVPTAVTTLAEPLTDTQTPYWQLFAALLVIAVSLILLGRILLQLRQLKRLTQQASPEVCSQQLQLIKQVAKQLGLNGSPQVVYSASIKSPATWGLFKPVILLPMSITKQTDLRVVLLHEMAHIKRCDWAWMMAAQILTALFWFNPLLWFVKHRLIACFEAACDELVLQHQVKPSHYATTLLHFHNHHHNHEANLAAAMAKPSQMYQRLEHILNPTHRSKIMNNHQQHFILTLGSVLLFLIASSQISMAHDQTVHDEHTPPAVAHPPEAATVHPSSPTHPEIAPVPDTLPAALTPPQPPTVDSLPTAPLPAAARFPTLHANELPLEMKLEHAEKMGISLETLEQRFELAHQRIDHADQDIHPVKPHLLERQEKLKTEERRLHLAQQQTAREHELKQHRALSQQKQRHKEQVDAIHTQRAELQQHLQASQQEIRSQQQALIKLNEQAKKQELVHNQQQAEELERVKQELARTQAELAATKEALKKHQ